MGLTVTRPVQDPLVVEHLDNGLCMPMYGLKKWIALNLKKSQFSPLFQQFIVKDRPCFFLCSTAFFYIPKLVWSLDWKSFVLTMTYCRCQILYLSTLFQSYKTLCWPQVQLFSFSKVIPQFFVKYFLPFSETTIMINVLWKNLVFHTLLYDA